jgi:chromosomal replication initiation ATPase DnaA
MHILDKYKIAWDRTKGILQREISKGDFDTWVKDVDLVDVDGDTFILVAQNEYARDWLEQRLQPKIEKLLTPQVFGDSDESVKVKFVSVDELEVELK